MSKKNIIVVTTHLTNGGAQRVLSQLITVWTKSGSKVTVVQTNNTDKSIHYDIPEGVDIINLKIYKQELLGSILNVIPLMRILRNKKDATVLAMLNPCIILVALTSFFVKNKIVFSERNDPDRYPTKRYKRKLRDILFIRADVSVFQTVGAMKHFSKKVQKKGVIIPNPINQSLPDPFKGEREKKIIAIGRLAPQKNFQLLIKAFNSFLEKYPDYKLFIFGNDEGEGVNLKSLIEEKQISSNVVLAGFSKTIFDELNKSSMYISSSDYEGVSNSMLEALALGVPTICTDCPPGGAREVITDHVNGILVPVGDQHELEKAMTEIIDDKALAERIGQEAIKIRQKYPIGKIAIMWLDIM